MIQKYFKYFLSIGFLILSLNSQLFAYSVLGNATSSSLFGDDELNCSVKHEIQTNDNFVEAHFSRLFETDNLQLFFELVEDDKFDEEIVSVELVNQVNYLFYSTFSNLLGDNLGKLVRVFPTHSNTEITTSHWYILFQVFRI